MKRTDTHHKKNNVINIVVVVVVVVVVEQQLNGTQNSPRHHPHRCQQYLTGGMGKHSIAAPVEYVFSGHATHSVKFVAMLRLL
jgi:hypothetical protein